MSNIWEQNLDKLKAFKRDYGHTNVPKNFPDQKLARLVVTLRYQKRKGQLKPERELELYKLGFDFEPQMSQWHKTYDQLVEFIKLNGFQMPSRRSEHEHERTLADWVHRMHKLIRQDALSIEQTHLLSLLNIDGNPADYRLTPRGLPEKFEKLLQRLRAYQQQHSAVVTQQMADPVLYRWLLLQKERIDKALISPKEYSALLKTGLKIESDSKRSPIYFVNNGS